MTERSRISCGLAGVVLSVVTVGATLVGALAGPAAAATCLPIYVSASGTQTNPANLLEFASGANSNVAPANTIGGPRNSKMVTASGIAQDSNGFTYLASPHINTLNVYSPGASGDVAPFATLSGVNPGLNNPQGIVVRNDRLYVANGPFGGGLTGSPSIAVFALPLAAGVNNVAPVAVIAGPATGLLSPFGLALDASGNIFVANVNNTVTEYAPPPPSSYASPNNAAPILTISTGPSAPEGIAIHANTLYSANDNNTITEYSLPSGALINTIAGANTGLALPLGIDVDSSGNLFVVNAQIDTTGNQVLEFAPGATGNAAPIAVIAGSATLLSSPQFVFIAPCSGPASLGISTTSLPAATVGSAYSQSLAASGGAAPYSWSLSAGTLPAGLSLSSAGVISGTPTTTGTSNFTVRVSDASNPVQSATKALSLTVGGSVGSPLKITTTSPLPAAKVGVAYSKSLAATRGTRPYSWSLSAGTLPPGLNLSNAGVISGTPTKAGTFKVTVKVTDSSNPALTAKKALTLIVR